MPKEMPKKDSLNSMGGLPRQDIPLTFSEDAKEDIEVKQSDSKKKIKEGEE